MYCRGVSDDRIKKVTVFNGVAVRRGSTETLKPVHMIFVLMHCDCMMYLQ
jgi:hypothetical protein